MNKFVFAALSLFALVACKGNLYNEEEIRTNALGYLQAAGDYHFDEAVPFCTRHTRENTLETFRYLLAHSDTAYINSNRPSVFTIHKICQLDDSTASVHYHKSTPIREVDDSLTLRYEDGHWLADVRLAAMPVLNREKPQRQAFPRDVKRVPPDSAKILLKRMSAAGANPGM